MATDATGTPTTTVQIPKFNVSVDAPSGLGGNAQMDFIDKLLSGAQALGSLGWGPTPGGTTVDVNLYRSATGGTAVAALKTDNILLNLAIGSFIYHSADQAIATGTPTILAFDSEVLDNDTMHDTVTNNSRLVAKTAGKYLLVANAWFAPFAGASSVSTVGQIRLRKNGTTYLNGNSAVMPGASATSLKLNCAILLDLAVNDYVELEAYQNTGGSLSIMGPASAGTQYGSSLSLSKVG